MKTRMLSTTMAVTLALGTLLTAGAPRPAAAAGGSEKTWKIATYVLGAGTIYALAKNKDTLALIGGVGTAIAAKKWKDSVKSRHESQRRSRYARYRGRRR